MSADKEIYLYALKDKTGIRYIGKSWNPNYRFLAHIRESKKGKTHKNNWIKSLINKGERPEMIILHKCRNNEESVKLEIELIKHYKTFCNLTNISEGGDGNLGNKTWLGKKHKEETKIKQSITKLGELNPSRKRMKPVLQCTLNGEVVKEWISGIDAARELNLQYPNINKCCNNIYGHKTVGGFIWKFKDTNKIL